MQRSLIATMVCLVVCGMLIVSVSADQKPEAKQKPTAQKNSDDSPENEGRPVSDLRQFMRAKLAASNKVLEGLATEDMALVKEGALALNKMSLSEKWRTHNDVMYKQFSSEFQRVTRDLIQAAEQENLDQATLKWMGATMACIECHRFVRTMLVVDTEELK